MAGNTPEYRERTPGELFDEYKHKAQMGAVMHENSMNFLMAFTGYKPKSGEPL